VLGPGDSHYELGPAVDDLDDDSQSDLRVLTPETRPSDQSVTATPLVLPRPEQSLPGRSPEQLSEKWCRVQKVVAIAVGALSLALMALFLWSLCFGMGALDSSRLALLTGLAGSCGVVVIAFSATALCILQSELLHFLRRLQVCAGASALDSHEPGAG
jgi:hypothetical protein